MPEILGSTQVTEDGEESRGVLYYLQDHKIRHENEGEYRLLSGTVDSDQPTDFAKVPQESEFRKAKVTWYFKLYVPRSSKGSDKTRQLKQ